ncbi:hypothetical protein LDG_7842 [Legionella drancourtii LLAP12]|uniref:Uncharacterized protein n=1 Tax=Legionella drancourtii LLAP12 TaxID=658187 RepID=G9ERD0_9GAMM|nr:hypothetical protein LDG_7842 [Legionella drancourtii LLAP12]
MFAIMIILALGSIIMSLNIGMSMMHYGLMTVYMSLLVM